MIDTSAIHSVIAKARRRMRLQLALQYAAIGAIGAIASMLVVVMLVRSGVVGSQSGLLLVLASGAAVVVAAAAALVPRLPTRIVATKVDHASGLADRLATACAFETQLKDTAAARRELDPETVAMMEAAIRDATSHVARANVSAAVPFTPPVETGPVIALGIAAAAVAGLAWSSDAPPTLPVTGTVTLQKQTLPDETLDRGTVVVRNMRTGQSFDIALGKTGPVSFEFTLEPSTYEVEFVANASLCDVEHTMPCEGGLQFAGLAINRSAEAQTNQYSLLCTSSTCEFNIDISRTGKRLPSNPVELDDEDYEVIREQLDEWARIAKETNDPHLQAFVDKIREQMNKVKRGELTKEQLLDKFKKAEEEFNQGGDDNPDQTMNDLKETGKQLAKNKHTRELGKALQKGDLEQAKKEMEKLADKIANEQIKERDLKNVARNLDQAAKQFEKREQQRDKRDNNAIERTKRDLKRLQREKDNAKTQPQKDRAERKLERKRRELKRLRRQQQQREQSQQRRRLKRLHRNLRESAKDMRSQDKNQRKQASRKLRDAAKDTGRVSQDVRRTRNRQRARSQLRDLKDAMRRARRRNNGRGPKNMFGKNRRNRDFGQRARGGRGSKQAWKPGQGRRPGQGAGGRQGQTPGQGGKAGKGGKQWGDGHDPNTLADTPTARSGNTVDKSVSGTHGRGPSTRETVLSAAQKGFASRHYKKVYAPYRKRAEEVMEQEKVPSGYKNYVKKYFRKIKPRD